MVTLFSSAVESHAPRQLTSPESRHPTVRFIYDSTIPMKLSSYSIMKDLMALGVALEISNLTVCAWQRLLSLWSWSISFDSSGVLATCHQVRVSVHYRLLLNSNPPS